MDKIGVGIIGGGAVGYEHIQNYQTSEHANVLAVVTRTEAHAKLAAEKFDIESWYTDYKDLLKRDDINAVSICTPNFLHAKMVIDAARAGKHIICEKPLATTMEEADKMIKVAREANVFLMNPSHQRFVPVLENVKAVLDLLGTITFVRYRFAHEGPYKHWGAISEDKWFFNEEKAGGGVLLDLGPHALDLLDWYFGEVDKVQSALLNTFEKPTKVEDNAILLLKFKSGIIAELDTSWVSHPPFNEFQIYGTKGTIKVDIWERSPIKIMPKKLKRNEKIKELSFKDVLRQISVSKQKMLHYFVDCVRNNKEPEMTGEIGRKILQVILAGYESAKTNSPIIL
ncbi:MAG: Gfo/Idh/MocA family oxidoreductase [Candidatus Helarchaeota archaeon]|nr:Gfo/Idh/MocA family oxidoreductase [Candidatus Helarchaeota archaeon]